MVYYCALKQGGIEGAFALPSVDSSAVCRGGGRREGYYALEAGSADTTSLLLKTNTKECQDSKEEGRKGKSVFKESTIPAPFGDVTGGSTSCRAVSDLLPSKCSCITRK